jgi:hypothetical protein
MTFAKLGEAILKGEPDNAAVNPKVCCNIQ